MMHSVGLVFTSLKPLCLFWLSKEEDVKFTANCQITKGFLLSQTSTAFVKLRAASLKQPDPKFNFPP